MIVGSVSDAVLARLEDHFDPKERVELILTAGMYAMVPRVVDALRLPLPEQSA
jgi:alkylhydroperoxidase family enzyme